MGRLCLIYNFAQHYRANIFTLMDQELECDFVFGDRMDDVKKMDYSLLDHFKKEVQNKVFVKKPFYYQKGVIPLLREEYSTFLVLGELICISTWVILILSIFGKKKVYLWSHGFYGREGTIKRVLKRIFFSMSAGVFLYGHHARRLMVEAGINSNKLHVIYNSLDYDKQLYLRKKMVPGKVLIEYFKNDHKTLVFIGRLTYSKRLDIILDAMSLLKADNHLLNLVLIGEGEMSSALLQQARLQDLEQNIWFFGACYDEEVIAELIGNADLCVSPGNVGLTAIHTMSFGTPVITHDHFAQQGPEFEAIEEGITGSFFSYGDSVSLAESIQGWFASAPDRERVRQKCFQTIDEKYNPHIQIETLKTHLTID